ncbi:dna mismatch repair protein [Phaffia rhodozyma]|uniref:Dna mismatch repair protein n=1 Tax=Phaffia rhodozyma TaxID=264483 RepID=A0A0F7SR93_PHARH|nr:dna mismatch repair protein [Phaffia rhodozyma]
MASNILPIDKPSVHRITSGQVVTDLQTAIKELVENALDAGSTSVEVRFKDFGLEVIEVVDNGSGINKVDYPSIALKHHTSKLTSFADLSSVSSFGFRGEALSSLCALSESVEVVTATQQEAPLGTIITFNRLGQVVDSTKTRGTTVTIKKIFQPVPVRRYEFNKNAKREFAKALHLLTAYALVSCLTGADVRISVVGTGKGKGSKRTVHLQTTSSTSLRTTISALWGPKAPVEMQPISLELELIDKEDSTTRTYRLEGMISLDGHGRSSPDRQFYSIKYLAKMINEVYRSTNPNQSPVVILDLQLPKTACDVNVTADKRTIFLHDETDIVDGFRSKLLVFFSHSSSNSFPLPLSSVQTQSQNETQQDSDREEMSPPSTQQSSIRDSRPYGRSDGGRQTSILSVFGKRLPEKKEELGDSANEIEDHHAGHDVKESEAEQMNEEQSEGEEQIYADDSSKSIEPDSTDQPQIQREILIHRRASLSSEQDEEEGESENGRRKRKIIDSEDGEDDDGDGVGGCSEFDHDDPQPLFVQQEREGEDRCTTSQPRFPTQVLPSPPPLPSYSQTDPRRPDRLSRTTLRYSLSSIQSHYRCLPSLQTTSDDTGSKPRDPEGQEMSEGDLEISDIRSSAAEETLDRIVLKSDFKQMNVLGQFNLGFIITSKRGKEGREDLFIVDQHAADEKVNFELLQKETKIQSQKLIRPRPLELSAVDTVLVQDNLSILRKNGFDVEFSSAVDGNHDDEETEPNLDDGMEGESWYPGRVSLCAQPVSKETVFDFQDLEELLHLIRESPSGEMVRCSKARRMFASRACRKSIMVGKPLSKRQMLKVLENMGRIDQPWNCPHGRPTMRHLIHLGPPKKTPKRRLDWETFSQTDDI